MQARSLSRYEIRGVLGRGGAGVVYEAFDTKDRTLVALKTIDTTLAEDLYRLKREFRALADVQHKNLVRLGELSCDRDEWFFTMELVRGKIFTDYLRAITLAPAADDVEAIEQADARLRDAFVQLVDALVAIHDAGHVHRDVKPTNVLVTDEGRVVLLDFGLVRAVARAPTADEEGEVVGTPAFMAPEQIGGSRVGPAADWYAVGVMLFQALTGQLPFRGSATAIMEAKLAGVAPAPREFVPGVPADLDTLCSELLRTQPAARPTADAIRARLGVVAADPHPSHVAVRGDAAPPFVGRGRELDALEQARDDVAAGRPRMVVVAGEPGVGKSALVQHFLQEAEGAGTIVLSGRCYEQETVPFKGVDSIVDALAEHLLARPTPRVQKLIAGGVRALSTVFRVLRRVPAIAEATENVPEMEGSPTVREQALGELERLLAALTRRGMVVLFLDDLQWADRDSVALLRRVLLGPTAPPCLFLATLRSGAELAPELAALAAAAETIELGALSAAESGALWDALAAARGASATSPGREALLAEAGGHPLFLAELERSTRAGTRDAGGHGKLQDVLHRRISERDELDQRFLEMVAIAGAPTPYEVIAAAAGVDVGECQTRLSALRAAQLIRVSRRGDHERMVEAYHDRIREAILLHREGGPAGARSLALARLRLGRALLASTPEGALGARVFAIVQHMDAGRDFLVDRAETTRVAELQLLASRNARLTTAYERAREHARRGLELLGPAGWRDAYPVTRDLHVARVAAELYAGDFDAAKACFDAAKKQLTSAADRTDLYVVWVGLEASRNKLVEALDAGRERLAELGTVLPTRVTQLTMLREYAAARLAQGQRVSDEMLHVPALTDPARAGAMKLLVALAPAAFFVDTNLVIWILLEIAKLSMRHGLSDVSAYGFVGYGIVLSNAFGKHAEGASFGRVALALNERFRNDALTAKLHHLNGGWLVSWVRPFADAKAELRVSYEAARKNGDTSYEAYAATVLALVAFCESHRLADVQESAEWAREIALQRRDGDMAGIAEAYVRQSAALRGATPDPHNLGLAASSDADWRASLTDEATPAGVFYYFYCNAELAYLFGDVARAEALLVEARKRLQVIFGVPTTAEHCLLECLVAARRHDDASWGTRMRLRGDIAAGVRKLRAWSRSCPANFEAHYLIAAAELARIRGDAYEADLEYGRAVTAARAHHAPKREALALELAAAHAEARRNGARARQLRRSAAEAYGRWGAFAKVAALTDAPEPEA